MIDTELAPVLGPAIEVYHELWKHGTGDRVVIVVRHEDDVSEYVPLPGTPCRDCGRPLQATTDCAVSGTCLWCLYGPPFVGAVRAIGNTP